MSNNQLKKIIKTEKCLKQWSTSASACVLIRYEMLVFLEINFSLMVSIEGGQINEMDEAFLH